MFCPVCGTNVTEGVGFCPTCGKSFGRPEPRNYGGAAVKDKVMALLGSPMFVVACICTVVSFLFTMFSWLNGDFGMGILYSNPLTRELVQRVPYEIYRYMEIIVIVANIPTMMEIIGVVILLCTIKSSNKGAGFVFIKIGLIMEFVALAIVLTFVVIGLFGGMFAGIMNESSEAVAVVLIVGMLVAAIFVIVFMYVRGLIGTVGIAQDAISDNRCTKQPSMFVVVLNFMIVGSNVISMFVTMVGVMEYAERLSAEFVLAYMLPSILSVVGLLMFTLIMIQGRSLVNANAANIGPSVQMYGGNTTGFDNGASPMSETRQCFYCGRTLYGNENCNCRNQSNGSGSNGNGTTFL